ncbi:hypothetical protein Y900_007440 [Mycolicibacterium aromaticivorans JS19b1 = JCM 16368]|uniref:Uncharacterized protein n=1 Tax=Mycolicibacterium aromaticivorans JS19b1 = JCM 16368 TaxID=1440774 RepID=A0A064CJ91_9MYCO|nr:hypothetical protein [Mycolicibacterium aromaticivorans]KDE98783.1 hypothetical protein Y900_007440 [Mycolicibacterium aromaticivorans JS19b1 = JCM 16368]
MPINCRGAIVGAGAALAAVAAPGAAAHADPLPVACTPANVIDNVCTTRLTSVTADAVNGTITGIPLGGRTAITLAGQGDAYLKSTGFGDSAPEPVERWDSTIDSVSQLSVDQFDPSWHANAKTRVFMPRTLNDLATQFPPDVLVVRFTPDDAQPGAFRLVSIQPTPPGNPIS